MAEPKTDPVASVITEYLGRLRHPWLFAILLVLFLLDLLIPDFIPFVDEVMFGLLTVLFGSWRDRREQPEPEQPPKDVTSRGRDEDA
jgi:hypothetical protein